MRRAVLLLALVLASAPASAHVGSPNVFFDGAAGPYPLRVIIRPPIVIPGTAEVTVRLESHRRIDQVSILPLLFQDGFKPAPDPDRAKPVPGAPGVWSGQLLVMHEGSWNIQVAVEGADGKGMVQVPMPAVRSQLLDMDRRLGGLLLALGAFLFVGAVSIVGAAAREASLPPGLAVDRRRIVRARLAAGLSAVLFGLAVWGGKVWWDSAESQMRTGLYEPFSVVSTVRVENGRPRLSLAISDERSPRDWMPLIPDHGKLMHMFLVREPGLDAFAHLHPVAQDEQQKSFLSDLPPLPAGSYRLYADIVDENGFAQTLVDRVEIPDSATAEGASQLDADDSWWTSAPLGKPPGGKQVSQLADGGTMVWNQEPLTVGRETTMRFEVRGADGQPAALEPYMGMMAHAVINRDDGAVFVHLHPMGTLNMAAQQVFMTADQSGGNARPPMDHSAHMAQSSIDHSAHAAMPGMDHSAPARELDGTVSFPYEFPQPGRYRVWVQVKSAGRVLTGVFNAEVGPS